MTKKSKKPPTSVKYVPELILTFKGDKDKNNALYTVRIPREFLPKMPLTAAIYEYRFIGIKNGEK